MSPKSVFAADVISVPSKFISTPSPRSATGSVDAVRLFSASRYAGGPVSGSFPGNSIGAGGPRELPAPSSIEMGARALRSALATEEVISFDDVKLDEKSPCVICTDEQAANKTIGKNRMQSRM